MTGDATGSGPAPPGPPEGGPADQGLALVPVGLRVEGRLVLVVGAGPIAARKARAYADQGALLRIVAPAHHPTMDSVPARERHRRPFRPDDLDGCWLAVTATGDRRVDGSVFAEAERRRVWCNAADDPAHCSVVLPAVSRRGPITVSVSTGGTSPAVASWLRRRIDALVDDDFLTVARVATGVRDRVRAAGHRTEVPAWARVLDGPALDLVRGGREAELERLLEHEVVADQDGERPGQPAAPRSVGILTSPSVGPDPDPIEIRTG